MLIADIEKVRQLMSKVRKAKSYKKAFGHHELSCGVGYYENNPLESLETAYFSIKFGGVDVNVKDKSGHLAIEFTPSETRVKKVFFDFSMWVMEVEKKLRTEEPSEFLIRDGKKYALVEVTEEETDEPCD